MARITGVRSISDTQARFLKIWRSIIDHERMGRDLELGGVVFTIETGFEEIHVFLEPLEPRPPAAGKGLFFSVLRYLKYLNNK